jgi:hypothetical protein
MRVEDFDDDQLAEYHLTRVARGMPHEGIAYFMQQYKPDMEFLYDLEDHELEELNQMSAEPARMRSCSGSTSEPMLSLRRVTSRPRFLPSNFWHSIMIGSGIRLVTRKRRPVGSAL